MSSRCYPSLHLDDLHGVCEDGCRGAGQHAEEEGPARVHLARHAPLEELVHRELDGRVADQHEGGGGAAPQAAPALETPNFAEAILTWDVGGENFMPAFSGYCIAAHRAARPRAPQPP